MVPLKVFSSAINLYVVRSTDFAAASACTSAEGQAVFWPHEPNPLVARRLAAKVASRACGLKCYRAASGADGGLVLLARKVRLSRSISAFASQKKPMGLFSSSEPG